MSKQIPRAYTTREHGPVFAYGTRDDVHATCVTSRDEYVVVHHDDLRGLFAGEPGADVVAELEAYALEVMAPHEIEPGQYKKIPPRRSTVGEAVFGCRLFWSAVYAPGEAIEQGFGRPPRAAKQKEATT